MEEVRIKIQNVLVLVLVLVVVLVIILVLVLALVLILLFLLLFVEQLFCSFNFASIAQKSSSFFPVGLTPRTKHQKTIFSPRK